MTDPEPTADNFDSVACRDAFVKWQQVEWVYVSVCDYDVFEAGARWQAQRDRQATTTTRSNEP